MLVDAVDDGLGRIGVVAVRHSADQQRNEREIAERPLQEGELELQRVLFAVNSGMYGEEPAGKQPPTDVAVDWYFP